MIDTVLFDIGGTLITQTHSPQRSLLYSVYVKHLLAEIGIAVTESDQAFYERIHDNAESYKHLGETTGKELAPITIWKDYILKDYNISENNIRRIADNLSFTFDYIRMYNNPRETLKETLEQLKNMGMKLGIITNTISTSFADHILREYGVSDYFPVIVKSCEFGRRKPDRSIFDHTMELIGSTRETTCYVGDTISRDVLGSRNAELAMVIKIKNNSISHRDKAFQGTDAPKADFDIDNLIEIPEIIKTFNEERT